MNNTKQIESFINGYHTGLKKLSDKLNNHKQTVEDIEMEVRFIRDVEMTQAIKKRLLDDDATMEDKLKKKLSKLESQLLAMNQETPVLESIMEDYKLKQGKESSKLERLLRDEMSVAETTSYNNMMKAKKAYFEVILQEAKTLQNYNKLDSSLQQVQVNAGRKNNIYSGIQVKTAPSSSEAINYNGIYLQVTYQDLQRIITGNFSSYDIGYLKQ
ncbi:hypothetical protein VBD025_03945 [Virgibacillus flavescens]|uniref:hypothetical protein n=1 Tax=Virgibacillus flavescens TaxID=1611422 RepID=UPI003D3430B5